MSNELLPCPFCNASAQVSTADDLDCSHTAIHCSRCGNAGFSFTWLGSEQEAIARATERWNRRASYDKLAVSHAELVVALRALLTVVEGTAGGHLAADVLEGAVVMNARSAITRAKDITP